MRSGTLLARSEGLKFGRTLTHDGGSFGLKDSVVVQWEELVISFMRTSIDVCARVDKVDVADESTEGTAQEIER